MEKFYLKKELAYERKRYNDLKSAFIELRKETKDKELDYLEKDKLQLVDEKIAMQNTITTLTDEIEALSVKNEEFLASLRHQDFYNEYQNVHEELKNLKDAHALLINMIKDEEIQVNSVSVSRGTKSGEIEDSKDVSFISDLFVQNKPPVGCSINTKSRVGPLQEIDPNKGRNAGLSSIFS